MSQAKVDARKQNKKNRKKIMAKEKRVRTLERFVLYLVAIAFIGGLGWSIYRHFNPEPPYDITAYYNLITPDAYGILSPTLPE